MASPEERTAKVEPRASVEGRIDPFGVLDAVTRAVIVTDADGVIRLWNRAAEDLYGWPAAEVVGRPVLEVTPAEHVAAEAEAIMRDLRAGQDWSGEMVLSRRDGSTFLAMVSDRPVLDARGEVIALVGVSEDISERRWVEEAHRRSDQRLRLALAAGRLGVWEWDDATGLVTWDSTMEDLFCLEPGTFAGTLDAYLELLHPEDREPVLALVEGALVTGEGFSLEHRVVCPDGSIRWLQGDGQPRLDEAGEVRGLIGVTVDVTERHRAEAERIQLLAAEASARAEAEAARARIEFLSDAAAALGEPLELSERLQRLTRLGVPRFADASAVYLLDDDGEPALLALHHRDPDQEQILVDLIRRYPVRLDSPVGVGAAIRRSATVWLPEVDESVLAMAARSEGHLAELRALQLTAGIAVPLVGPEGALGAVAFVTVGGRKMTDDDVALAEELCRRIGTLIHNGRLLEARDRDRAIYRYQAALLQALFEASVDGMLAVDPRGQVLASNRRFLQLWGFDEDLLAGGDDVLLQAAAAQVADPESFLAGVRHAYDDAPVSVHDEVLLADGRVLDRHGTPIVDEDGHPHGFTWSFRDVTSERAQQAEIVAAGERFATLARTLQQSLLPPNLPSPTGLELAARYHPAFEGVDVGGDFYDVFAVGQDWVLVIGDVCGKGPEAAALTALARYTIRASAIHDPDPASVLRELNRAMLAHQDGPGSRHRFATVACVHLVGGSAGVTAEVACGGHPLPLVLRADGSIEAVGRPGTLLGVLDQISVETTSTLLGVGDTLVTVTDGVLEARRHGELLGDEGLVDLLGTLNGRSAAEISAAIEARALDQQGGIAHDDIAVLVARVCPEGTAP